MTGKKWGELSGGNELVYTKNLENDFQVVRHTYRYGVIEPKKKVEAGVKKNN